MANIKYGTKTQNLYWHLWLGDSESKVKSLKSKVIMNNSKIYIGTSGWVYGHWSGIFYPKDLPEREWLEYYSQYFETVEINSSFYHLPKPKTFENWKKRVPKDFIYAVKASRFITHVKKLKDCKEPWQRFEKSVKELRDKLGPILFQLPPSLKLDIKKLEKFIKILPYKYRYVFEFRHETWFCEEVYDLLKKYNIALCINSSPDMPASEMITADFTYLRFHGSKELYSSKYTEKELKEWAGKIKKWQEQGLEAYAYFNNDSQGHAIKNAKRLRKLTA